MTYTQWVYRLLWTWSWAVWLGFGFQISLWLIHFLLWTKATQIQRSHVAFPFRFFLSGAAAANQPPPSHNSTSSLTATNFRSSLTASINLQNIWPSCYSVDLSPDPVHPGHSELEAPMMQNCRCFLEEWSDKSGCFNNYTQRWNINKSEDILCPPKLHNLKDFSGSFESNFFVWKRLWFETNLRQWNSSQTNVVVSRTSALFVCFHL